MSDPVREAALAEVMKAAQRPHRNGDGACADVYPEELRGDAWEPPAEAVARDRRGAAQPEPPVVLPRLVTLANVSAQATAWLWRRRIARGTINLIDGDPGLGKSLVTLDIAARITRGWAMPPDDRCGSGEPGNVLLIGAEDDLARVVRPRLEQLGADLSRVFSLEEVTVDGDERPVELPTDLPLIEQIIRERSIALAAIDPVLSFISADYDSHKDADMRRLMHKVKKSAERTQAAFLLVRHLNKLTNVESAIY